MTQSKKNPKAPVPAKSSRAKEKEPQAYYDVADLPEKAKEKVTRLLIEGAPFEDVVEMVAEPGEVTITQRAVEHYFRATAKVQADRIAYQRSVADELCKALRRPQSTEAKLARAVLIMGLSGLNRGGESSRVKHAMQMMKEKKDERFKRADAQRKEAKLDIEEQEFEIRVQSLQAKLETATLQLDRLRESIKRQGKEKTLGPEIIQQIHDIYGIVSAPGANATQSENHEAPA